MVLADLLQTTPASQEVSVALFIGIHSLSVTKCYIHEHMNPLNSYSMWIECLDNNLVAMFSNVVCVIHTY